MLESGYISPRVVGVKGGAQTVTSGLLVFDVKLSVLNMKGMLHSCRKQSLGKPSRTVNNNKFIKILLWLHRNDLGS